jgi:2-aminoadipate transaminase
VRGRWYGCATVAVTPGARRWSELFAARTRADVGGGILEILALAADRTLIPFAGGFPDPATFPAARTAELLDGLVRSGDLAALQYSPTRGLPGPLDALAERLGEREGRRPAEGELLLTSGGIEALELVAKSFLDPGDTVVVEGPTYLGAIMAARGFEAHVVASRLDDDGLDVETLAAALAGGLRPKLLYTIPDHQNPAGVTLALERRRALVELARRYGVLVVEDVAYRELGFDGAALPSLWSLAPDTVVQVGTTSKTFFPGVRLGWAAGPAEVVAQLAVAKQNTDQCAGALGQTLWEAYARSGALDEQLVRSRALYRRRCELLLEAFGRHLPSGVRWTEPRGGFFSWLTLPDGLDAVEVARRAAAAGAAVVPGAPFFPDGGGGSNLRLAFSLVPDDRIDEGVRMLAQSLERTSGSAPA